MIEDYSKSKELGYDYLKDSKLIAVPEVTGYYQNKFKLSRYLDGVKLNKEEFLKACSNYFDEYMQKIQTNLNNYFDILELEYCTFNVFDDEIYVDLYRRETEEEFIKRMDKNKKNRERKKNQKIEKISKNLKSAKILLNKLNKTEKEKLLKELL